MTIYNFQHTISSQYTPEACTIFSQCVDKVSIVHFFRGCCDNFWTTKRIDTRQKTKWVNETVINTTPHKVYETKYLNSLSKKQTCLSKVESTFSCRRPSLKWIFCCCVYFPSCVLNAKNIKFRLNRLKSYYSHTRQQHDEKKRIQTKKRRQFFANMTRQWKHAGKDAEAHVSKAVTCFWLAKSDTLRFGKNPNRFCPASNVYSNEFTLKKTKIHFLKIKLEKVFL